MSCLSVACAKAGLPCPACSLILSNTKPGFAWRARTQPRSGLRCVVSPASLHCWQVFDLGLGEGDAVTGAALVGGRGGSKQKLVVLTKQKLLWYVIA